MVISGHLPGRVAEEVAVVASQKCLDPRATIAQAEAWAVTGVANGVIGPRQDDITQRPQRLLEILGRPSLARPAVEDGIADNGPRIPLQVEAHLIRDVAGSVVDTQRVLADGK